MKAMGAKASGPIAWLMAWSVLAGCQDQVVGQFDTSAGSTAGVVDTSEGTSAGVGDSSTETNADADETNGSEGFMPPGCFGDAFDDGVLDEQMWNTWIKADADVEQRDGVLVFTPATSGLFDSGIVTSHLYLFPFDDAWVRVRVPLPPNPAHPVVLFLTVTDRTDETAISIHLSQGQVTIDGRVGGMATTYSESFPTDPYPAWMQLRAEGDLVHHEISGDGSTWTTLGSYEKIAPFEIASALLMAQTYGDYPTPELVKADDFQACIGQ
jgi:hypothetical protein